jgi:hypothetical protein
MVWGLLYFQQKHQTQIWFQETHPETIFHDNKKSCAHKITTENKTHTPNNKKQGCIGGRRTLVISIHLIRKKKDSTADSLESEF